MRITRNKRYIGLAAAAAVTALVLGTVAACSSGGAQRQENTQQQADQSALEASQPLPQFDWSQYRQTLIDAETAEADNTQTTSFMFQQGDANPVASCPSIGEPVANTASLSDPQQVADGGSNSAVAISQMDPNGVYTPTNSSGTYVICLANGGSKYLFYWEGDVMTVAGAAQWNTQTHSVQVIGAPTAAIHTAPGATK